MTEVPPLFVIEFLHRVADTFDDYFGDASESVVKDNYVVVYELLDEETRSFIVDREALCGSQ